MDLFFMKKLSLLFIKISSSILAIDVFLKLLTSYYLINQQLINIIDISSKIILTIGFIILSHVFKYCSYHRILLYIVLPGYLWYLINNFLYTFTPFVTLFVTLALFIIIPLIFLIIYIYLKYGRTITINSRK